MKIKLAYLVSRYPAVSHTFIYNEVVELRKLGLNISVASINEHNLPLTARTEDEQKEIETTFYVKKQGAWGALKAFIKTLFEHPLGFFQGLGATIKLGGFYHLFYFLEAMIVGHWMERKELDHIHVHFANPASTVAYIVCKIFGFTYSISVHGPDEFDNVIQNHLNIKITHAKFLVCIGHYSQSQLRRHVEASLWKKIKIAPLGVDITLFTPKPFRRDPQPYRLLCVGRLVPAKGQHVLIAAVDTLIKKGHPISLHLVGDGPDMESLKEEVKRLHLQDHIFFEGSLNHTKVIEQYKKADIFVLASFAEGIPISLMEAMSMEIACVSTQITGIPELIRNEVDGLLVTASNQNELANAIEKLIIDPDYRLKIGLAGRERVSHKYSLQNNTKLLANIFSEFLS